MNQPPAIPSPIQVIIDETRDWLETVENMDEFCKACGVHPKTIREFRKRERNITTPILEKILEARRRGPPPRLSW